MTSRQKIKKNKKSDNSYRVDQVPHTFAPISNVIYEGDNRQPGLSGRDKERRWSQRGRIAYDNSLGQCRARHNVCGAKSRRELLGGIAWKYAHLSNTFDTVHGVT